VCVRVVRGGLDANLLCWPANIGRQHCAVPGRRPRWRTHP
jgi:hypothetical protein